MDCVTKSRKITGAAKRQAPRPIKELTIVGPTSISSDRKRGHKALREFYTNDNEVVQTPVWLLSFKHENEFRKELAGLEVANRLEVGPRLIESRDNVILLDGLEDFHFHIVEDYVGISLSAMMKYNSVAAPTLHSDFGNTGVSLAVIGTETRRLQAAKIAFDIGCELKALHDANWFYNDLKPSNISVQAFGNTPLDIKATLIDFESMSISELYTPETGTQDLYKKLNEYSGRAGLSGQAFDLGCLTLTIAALLSNNPVAKLTRENIDAAQSICGKVFCRSSEGALEITPLSSDILVGIAKKCGLKKEVVSREIQETCVAKNRQGYLDLVDFWRINKTPAYLLNSTRYKMAVAFHAIWAESRASRNEVAIEFENQSSDLRAQGFAQADSIIQLFAKLGYKLVPIDLGSAQRAVNCFPDCDLIAIARNEHERWMAKHIELGYRYSERKSDGSRLDKCNEYLLPWEKLAQIGLDGGPIKVDTKSVRELKKTRAANDIAWAQRLIGVLRDVANLTIVRAYRK